MTPGMTDTYGIHIELLDLLRDIDHIVIVPRVGTHDFGVLRHVSACSSGCVNEFSAFVGGNALVRVVPSI